MIIIPRPVRCVFCRKDFYVPQADSCCPHCQYSGLPMYPEENATVEINWQELRILTIWAEMWVKDHKDHLAGIAEILSAIVKPLQEQFPSFRPLLIEQDPTPPIN